MFSCMKNIKIILCILFVIVATNNSFAIKNISWKSNNSNTYENIKQSETIERKTLLFKKNLINLQIKYGEKNDIIIKKYLSDLDKIIYILKAIQTKNFNKERADELLKSVIQNLKRLNISTKTYLRNIKKKHVSQIKKYNFLSSKLSRNLKKFIYMIVSVYTKKSHISTTDKKILTHVQIIQKETHKLQYFSTFSFQNSQSAKKELINILNKIKQEFSLIKQIKTWK